jgi:hypothetical protein
MGVLDYVECPKCETCGHVSWTAPHVCDGCGRRENDPKWIDVEWEDATMTDVPLSQRWQSRTVCSWECAEVLAERDGVSKVKESH